MKKLNKASKKSKSDSSPSLKRAAVEVKSVQSLTPPISGVLSSTVIHEQFKAVSVLGEGSFGAVYQAVHIPTERKCAAKVLALRDVSRLPPGSKSKSNPEAVELGVRLPRDVRREIEAMRDVRSEYVVRYWAHGVEDAALPLRGGRELSLMEGDDDDDDDNNSDEGSSYSDSASSDESNLSILTGDTNLGTMRKHRRRCNVRLWIFVELCNLGSCRDVIDMTDSAFSENVATVILHHAMMGLAAIHKSKRVHRDLKSENIFLHYDRDGKTVTAKLGDLGVASAALGTLGDMNKCSTFVGTPYFIAPEVINSVAVGAAPALDQGYSFAADIWSLGIVACELLERQPPRFEMEPIKALFFIPKNPPPTLRSDTKASSVFRQFIKCCLVLSPDGRPTAEEASHHELFIGSESEKVTRRGMRDLVKLAQEVEDIARKSGGLYHAARRRQKQETRTSFASFDSSSVSSFPSIPSQAEPSSGSGGGLTIARDGSVLSVDFRKWVWAPDKSDVFALASVESDDGSQVSLQYRDGTKFVATKQEFQSWHVFEHGDLTDVDDCSHLSHLSDGSLLHNIRQRYERDAIYTHIGARILAAVNPYKSLPIYSEDDMLGYSSSDTVVEPDSSDSRAQRPHIFSVAEYSFRQLVTNRRNQTVIVGGESGSGKTESAKYLLLYLMHASAGASGESALSLNLQRQILDANVLLEAFGNAQTVQNNNSSRFGKFIGIHFRDGEVVSAKITHFLLEKSRICKHSTNERNYHIFYYLIAGLPKTFPDLARRLQVSSEEFAILSSGGVRDTRADIAKDEQAFRGCVSALTLIGVSPVLQQQLWQVLAGLMHLGNVTFKPKANKPDASEVTNPQVRNLAAQLLGCEAGMLELALCARSFASASKSGTRYSVPLNVSAANSSKDALAKVLYGLIFSWVVETVNQRLCLPGSGDNTSALSIGILDIFGFECFETNSFEQLCINFANEKLQGFFNERVFKEEQDDCRRENISTPHLSAISNDSVLSCFEDRGRDGLGIWATLDDECFFPNGSDDSFSAKLQTNLEKRENFVSMLHATSSRRQLKAEQLLFLVKHYAGDVAYDARGFLEKNRDEVHSDLLMLIQESSDPLVKRLADFLEQTEPDSKQGTQVRRMPTRRSDSTVSGKFRQDLQRLLLTLKKSEVYFIRCIKPNSQKLGGLFDPKMVIEQLRRGGVLEAVRIRKAGFPLRVSFDAFGQRYGVLQPGAMSLKGLVSTLCSICSLPSDSIQVGTTKVFVMNVAHVVLEHRLTSRLDSAAQTVQRFFRFALSQRQAARRLHSMSECASALIRHASILNRASRAIAARKMAEELMRARRLRVEAEKREAARLAAEREAERVAAQREAERLAAQREAERLAAQREAERLAAQREAERLAAQQEANRLAAQREVERLAGQREAERLESQREAERQRLEAERAEASLVFEPERSRSKTEVTSTWEEEESEIFATLRKEARSSFVQSTVRRHSRRGSVLEMFAPPVDAIPEIADETNSSESDHSDEDLDDSPKVSIPTMRRVLGLTEAERAIFHILPAHEREALIRLQTERVVAASKAASPSLEGAFLYPASSRWKFADDSLLPPPPPFRGLSRSGKVAERTSSNPSSSANKSKNFKFFTRRTRPGDIWGPSWAKLSELMKGAVKGEVWNEYRSKFDVIEQDETPKSVFFDSTFHVASHPVQYLMESILPSVLQKCSTATIVSTDGVRDPSTLSFDGVNLSNIEDMECCWFAQVTCRDFPGTYVSWLIFKEWPLSDSHSSDALVAPFEILYRRTTEYQGEAGLILHSWRSCGRAVTLGVIAKIMEEIRSANPVEVTRINIPETVALARTLPLSDGSMLHDAVPSVEDMAVCYRVLAADLELFHAKRDAAALAYRGGSLRGLSVEFASLLNDLGGDGSYPSEETSEPAPLTNTPSEEDLSSAQKSSSKPERRPSKSAEARATQLASSSERARSFRKGRKARKKGGEIVHYKWPHRRPYYKDLASVGFFFDPTSDKPDRTTCFECLKSYWGWQPTDAPLFIHERLSPDCPCVAGARLWIIRRDEAGFRYHRGDFNRLRVARAREDREARNRVKKLNGETKGNVSIFGSNDWSDGPPLEVTGSNARVLPQRPHKSNPLG